MKLLLLIGGLSGFGIGLIFSLLQENSWPSALWHASLGAYLGGLLMRWWGGAWQKSLTDAMREREAKTPPAKLPIFAKGSKP